jgi:hypothetical protein
MWMRKRAWTQNEILAIVELNVTKQNKPSLFFLPVCSGISYSITRTFLFGERRSDPRIALASAFSPFIRAT